jgi:hypothetical protein
LFPFLNDDNNKEIINDNNYNTIPQFVGSFAIPLMQLYVPLSPDQYIQLEFRFSMDISW